MHAHVCVSEAGRLLGETYKEEGQVKFTSPSSCSVHSPHAVHSHKHAHTHMHVHAHCYTAHTLPALTIHLSTLFYSFYQYCCYTFQAFPGFLVCCAQRGKTSQPYLFTSKNSFIIIIIFQNWFIIIADVFFLIFLTILKRRTWHLLQVFYKTCSCSLTEDYDVGCWLISVTTVQLSCDLLYNSVVQ